MSQEHDLFVVARQLRYDLTAMQAKVSDLLNLLAAANLRPQSVHVCGACGLRFRGAAGLAEHVYVSHDGPAPEHWLRAELAAAETSAAGGAAEPAGPHEDRTDDAGTSKAAAEPITATTAEGDL